MIDNPVLRIIAKIIIPMILLFALYVQFHGDFGPGGGFQAGVIFAAGFILYGLVFGTEALRSAVPPGALRLLTAFGLLLSVGLQAMIHLSVVTGLAPPKGMNLPFVSDGGTSLLMSTLAVGLALGAARARPGGRSAPPPRGRNCFGRSLRLTGQNLVPEPPARITA